MSDGLLPGWSDDPAGGCGRRGHDHQAAARQAAMVKASHDGSADFALWSLDATGKKLDHPLGVWPRWRSWTSRTAARENVAIWSYTDHDRDLTVDEIGPYSGRHTLAKGTLLMEVTSEATWTITPS